MKALKGGFTTGSCAAAAAKAAVMLLSGDDHGDSVEITLPDNTRVCFGIHESLLEPDAASVVIIKDAGDDPDVTDGAHVTVTAAWNDTDEIAIFAGDGVGTVTLPGLQVPPGEPAINPVPRAMLQSAVRGVTQRGVRITISVPGGRELAKRTFNPKLGIVDGVSILGTTGRVKPYSCEAIRESLKCSLDIAAALGIKCPVLVPGNIGSKAAALHLALQDKQVVQVSNEWGFMLDAMAEQDFERVLALGHPGKLAKLAEGHWDTHSSRSPSAVPFTTALASETLNRNIDTPNTVDGLFASLDAKDSASLALALSHRIRVAVANRLEWDHGRVAIAITNMSGQVLGHEGDLTDWKETGT
ncbi:MAG: cobalt-precorrin-5B (C(1))-methyltransferase CbiD [Kiritimatiellia bacterium]|jgi:cobalt-precorrin-5B (C1)-methyltransferase|nr:cobalt-precorrin-5B (C(1))-methyltransferase CbiD [Kiritimatiellia bacterium]